MIESVLLRSLNGLFHQAGLEPPVVTDHRADVCLFPPKAPKFALPVHNGFAGWKNGAELYPGISPAHVLRKTLLVAGFPVWSKGRGLNIGDMQETAQQLYRALSEHAQYADQVAAFAVRGGSAGAGEKLIFQFQNPDGLPLCYIKTGDAVHRAPFLRNERDVYLTLKKSDAELCAPKVLGYKRLQFVEALEIQALNGARYFPKPGKMHVVKMLIDLFETTAVPGPWKPAEWAENLALLNNPATRLFVHRQIKIVQSSVFRCPLVHRDMAAWNIFSLKGRLGALDWEYGRSAHLPFQDLFHFLLHTELNCGQRNPVDVFRRVFFDAQNIELIRTYADAAGLNDPELINALRVVYLWDWFSFERSRAVPGVDQGSEYERILEGLAL
jgi:hypothetical protein